MIVDTSCGKVEGAAMADGVLRFAGIPFAEPPVGPRRFLPARPHPGWGGVRPAQAFGPIARQVPSPIDALLGAGPEPQDEDCLYLNVWTPACDDAKRPVLLWVHGGAFISGSGSLPVYHGERLARRGDVVVVTFNYRLGEFGFLELDGAGERFADSGNNGLADQLAALRWVRDNIAGFGGDPTNVTIFGESAGAMSVSALLAVPEAAGLFHRAIAQSGAANAWLTADQARETTDRYRYRLELTSVADLVKVPADQLLGVQAELAAEALSDFDASLSSGRPAGLMFAPVVDGRTLPGDPLAGVAAGTAADVALLVGTTADEWNLFSLLDPAIPTDKALHQLAARLVPAIEASALLAAYRAERPEANGKGVKNMLISDHVFRMPAVRLANAQRAHRPADTRMYLFSWPSSAMGGQLGACHAIELPFVFGMLDLPGLAMFLGAGDPPQALSEAIMDAWVAFARTGDPNHGSLPHWPAYDGDNRATMELNASCQVLSDPGAALRRLLVG
jgi:para-nitrobenzyl esterase